MNETCGVAQIDKRNDHLGLFHLRQAKSARAGLPEALFVLFTDLAPKRLHCFNRRRIAAEKTGHLPVPVVQRREVNVVLLCWPARGQLRAQPGEDLDITIIVRVGLVVAWLIRKLEDEQSEAHQAERDHAHEDACEAWAKTPPAVVSSQPHCVPLYLRLSSSPDTSGSGPTEGPHFADEGVVSSRSRKAAIAAS